MSQDTQQPPILSLKGRFNRLTFLGWNCLLLIANLLIGLIFISFMPNTIEAIFKNPNSLVVQAVFILPNIVFFAFTILFSIKRLHDFNFTGWMSLLLLIPFVNFFFVIFLIFIPGSATYNNYGEPRDTQTWESILAAILILLFIIILLAFGGAILSLLTLSS